MKCSTVTGAMGTERLPYPLISPFKGKREIRFTLNNLHTEHARLMRAAQTLVQDFEGIPRASNDDLPLRLELLPNELVWRTAHSLDRNRPFALFSKPGEKIRSLLDPEALEWLLYVEHRRVLHKAKLTSVLCSVDSLQSALCSIRRLERRLLELGGNKMSISDDVHLSTTDFQPDKPPDHIMLSHKARRRRRARKPQSIFSGCSAALRNLDDLSVEQARIVSALEELRNDWRSRVKASGIGLFPGDGLLPAMRWRVTNATQHGKRRRIDLTEPESTAILSKIDVHTALRAIATESIRIDWSARASAIHGSRLAYVEYQETLKQLQSQQIRC